MPETNGSQHKHDPLYRKFSLAYDAACNRASLSDGHTEDCRRVLRGGACLFIRCVLHIASRPKQEDSVQRMPRLPRLLSAKLMTLALRPGGPTPS